MGILLVSKDPAELMSLCDRVLVLRRGSLVADLPRAEFTRQKIFRLAGGGGFA
jgi:ABC-type sugar transport system ATPase subunit